MPAVLAGRTAPGPKRARAWSAAASMRRVLSSSGAEGQLPGGGRGVAEVARAQGEGADQGPLQPHGQVHAWAAAHS
ncbi:hypothetical protein ACFYSJ_30955 [Streptomyces sp. NPDC005248]|uniref:hypothetical protein n=1 Tax=unclassified Streptomyces TaxID=2593676 RepID=UPI00339DE66A